MIISSIENKNVKKLVSLSLKKNRDKLCKFFVEGKKIVEHIPLNWEVDSYFFSSSYANSHNINNYENRAKTFILSDSLFSKISDTVNSQGIVAICNKKSFNIEDVINNKNFILVGENISDPGNLGVLIRTADAAGCTSILLTQNSVDVYNPKSIRATAGSIFNIKVVTDLEIDTIINFLKLNNIKIFSMHLKGTKSLYESDFKDDCSILLGNEGRGLSEKASNFSDELIKIPMIGKAESLNVSVATSIVLYEALRQKNYN